MPEPQLRVAHLPRSDAPTSWVGMLCAAQERHGILPVPATESLWRIGQRRSVDVMHLHWLEFIAASDGRPVAGLARTLVRQARLVAGLAWLRLRGVRVVWTVHNLTPHEPVRPRMESFLGRVVSRLAHRVIAHSEYAKSRVQQKWGRGVRVTVMPLPNYIGTFPADPRSRGEIREALGLPHSAFVFLAFGQVRPYKRLPELVDAFSSLDGDDLRLVIAGRPVVAAEAERLQQAAAADPRIVLHLREIPDEQVEGLHRAADAGVLAYEDVFSSGALLLALSQGLPVVAADGGTAREIASGDASERFAPGRLADALDRMRATDPRVRSTAALAVAERFSWSDAGAQTAALYRSAVSGRRRQAVSAASRSWLSNTALHSDSE